MFFNRTGFNRHGPVMYTEVNVYAAGKAGIKGEYRADAAAAMGAESQGVAQPLVAAFVTAGAKSSSWIRAWIYSPGYVAADINGESHMAGQVFRSTPAQSFGLSKGYLRSKVFVATGIEGKCVTRSQLTGDPLKLLHGQSRYIAAAAMDGKAGAFRQSGGAMDSRGTLAADGSNYEVSVLTIQGIRFSPGDTIEIDLCNYHVSINGSNIMDKAGGSFFRLYPGTNHLIWQDDRDARQIEMKTVYQNKYL